MESNQVERERETTTSTLSSPLHHEEIRSDEDNMIVNRTRDNAPITTIKCLN